MVTTAKTSKKKPAGRYNTVKASPTTDEIITARGDLTQSAAAELIYSTLRTWQDWEYGIRPMHPGLYELFQIKSQALRFGVGSKK